MDPFHTSETCPRFIPHEITWRMSKPAELLSLSIYIYIYVEKKEEDSDVEDEEEDEYNDLLWHDYDGPSITGKKSGETFHTCFIPVSYLFHTLFHTCFVGCREEGREGREGGRVGVLGLVHGFASTVGPVPVRLLIT